MLLLLGAIVRPNLLFSSPFRNSNVWFVRLFHPFCEVAEKRMQFDSYLGKRVFHSWGSLWVDFTLDDLSLFQLVQSLREARSAYPLYPPLQLVESCGLLEPERVDDG